MAIDLPDHTLGFAQTLSAYTSAQAERWRVYDLVAIGAGATTLTTHYTVPADRRLIISNIIGSHRYDSYSNTFQLWAGGTLLIYSRDYKQAKFDFTIPVEFQEGEIVQTRITNGSAYVGNQCFVSMIGVLEELE